MICPRATTAALRRARPRARAHSTAPWFLEAKWRNCVDIVDCRSGTPVPAVRAGAGSADIVVCCEHASNRLPPEYAWSEADKRLVHDHWAYDPGAGDFACATLRVAPMARSGVAPMARSGSRLVGVVEVAMELKAVVLLARWSRLLIDLNRPVRIHCIS